MAARPASLPRSRHPHVGPVEAPSSALRMGAPEREFPLQSRPSNWLVTARVTAGSQGGTWADLVALAILIPDARRRARNRRAPEAMPSNDLEDGDVHLVQQALGGGDKNAAVEPVVGAGWRLEDRHRAKVHVLRIDMLAARKALHHLGRCASKASVRNSNFNAVRCADAIARLQLHHTIAAHVLPIGATLNDLARKARPVRLAAANGDDTSAPVRCRAQIANWTDINVYVANVLQLRRHASYPKNSPRIPQDTFISSAFKTAAQFLPIHSACPFALFPPWHPRVYQHRWR